MQIIIDTDKNLTEISHAIATALENVGQERGWDLPLHVMEVVMTRLTMGGWVDKAPGAARRVKRMYQAMAGPDRQQQTDTPRGASGLHPVARRPQFCGRTKERRFASLIAAFVFRKMWSKQDAQYGKMVRKVDHRPVPVSWSDCVSDRLSCTRGLLAFYGGKI